MRHAREDVQSTVGYMNLEFWKEIQIWNYKDIDGK